MHQHVNQEFSSFLPLLLTATKIMLQERHPNLASKDTNIKYDSLQFVHEE